MSEHNLPYNRLKTMLRELFQLDQADLDFGIYRIMNQKRDEITDFLDNRLITQVESTLNAHAVHNKEQLEHEVKVLEETLRGAGVDPDNNQKVLALRQQLYKADTTDLQNTIFSHLTNFFKRYYDEGDFISQRRYKDDVYAIPYQGEEVKLHWANHDQYYIKTSEYFKNYRFNLRNGNTVNFELVEASTEQNNNKSQNEERRFKLYKEPFKETDQELIIHFTYEPVEKKSKQDKLMKDAFDTLKNTLPNEWLTELLQPKPTKKDKKRTLLEKHLKEYTARNTFDYFIHKDLGGFLKRELDFYIKTEILQIDDIDLDNEETYRQSILAIKAFKKIAFKIIEFLAQLEEFQKKLWLKKKFVLQSDYCITLDRVDEKFYADIVTNNNQHNEWVLLYAIDEMDNYSEPLTIDFLKGHPFLMIDTKFYPKKWKYTLLATIDHLDDHTDGLIINSENFQALKFIRNRFGGKIDYVYIDPPYNANSSEILYKNTFKHSSWMSLMYDRLFEAKSISSNDSVHSIAIDEVEQENLGGILDLVFPDYKKNCLPMVHNPRGQQGKNISYIHEFTFLLYPSDAKKYIADLPKAEIDSRGLRDSGNESDRTDAKNCFYPFIVDKNLNIIGVGEIPPDDFHPEKSVLIDEQGNYLIYPLDTSGNEKKWRYANESVHKIMDKLEVKMGRNELQVIYNKDEGTMKSLWVGSDFDASEYGTKVLQKILGRDVAAKFSYPKSIKTMNLLMKAITNDSNKGTVLDYFAGSATTAHSIINLNRDRNTSLKYVLVEMGEYFNLVTKPRVQKIVYSKIWENGKPVDREGISHCFKYLRLESYEDTLNNLSLSQSYQQQQLLSDSELREEYMLRYMLEVESRDSLLTTEMFQRPFGYTINATEHNERFETEVDMVETFNYLIGLIVESIKLIQGYVVVVGRNNDRERILVIWRDVAKHSNQALEAFCNTMEFNPHDNEFDLIYVNGDNNLQNLRKDEDTWIVRLIEEAFHTLMFEKEGL